ncbi:hypothetical protein CcaverHIS631_0509650 [Cutaneotrichosporon cavernicola]|nr:hypothetical protein CcaverHIS631_0509650 [Cutaneotrichosporon cavernicola]
MGQRELPLSTHRTAGRSSTGLTAQFTSNPGRKVVNEPDVVTAIGRLLRTRGNGESLAHWSGIYPTFEGNLHRLIDFMWRNVSALEGPHDGAIMNHRFAGPGTLVLGFLPTTRI